MKKPRWKFERNAETLARRRAAKRAWNKAYREKKRKERPPQEPKPRERLKQAEDFCMNCAKKFGLDDHQEVFCIGCQWLALRLMKNLIQLTPVAGPLMAILLDGNLVGLVAMHLDKSKKKGEPLISLDERLVARILHRQGRLIERSSK